MTESNEVGIGSRMMSGDLTPGSSDRPGRTGDSEECPPDTIVPRALTDGTMSGLTQEEMEDIVERLRADVARMERVTRASGAHIYEIHEQQGPDAIKPSFV